MWLEEYQVVFVCGVCIVKEMVEVDFEQVGCGCVVGDVFFEFVIGVVCVDDYGEGVLV